MNFVNDISDMIIHSKAKVKLLTASPKANSFYKGGLIKS